MKFGGKENRKDQLGGISKAGRVIGMMSFLLWSRMWEAVHINDRYVHSCSGGLWMRWGISGRCYVFVTVFEEKR